MNPKDNVIHYEGEEFRYGGLFDFRSLFNLLKLLSKKQRFLEEKVNAIDARTGGKNYPNKNGPSNQIPPYSEKKPEKKPPKKNDENDFLDSEEDQKSVKNDDENLSKKPPHNEKISEEKPGSEIDNFDDDNKNINDNKDYNDDIKEENKDDSQKAFSEKSKNENGNDDNLLDEKKSTDENNFEDGQNKHEDIINENIHEKNLTEMQNIHSSYSKANKHDDLNFDEKNNNFNNDDDKLSTTKVSNTDLSNINNNNSDLISKIVRKLKAHERQINDLAKKNHNDHLILQKNIKHNTDNIVDNKRKIDQLKNRLDELNNKFLNFTDEFEKIKVKVQDFNVYDLFQGTDDGGNLDASKVLIMNLENKVFKKFGLYDERNKKFDKDIFKLQEDLKNSNGQIDNLKTNATRTSESLNELNNNFNNKTNDQDNLLSDLKKQIENLFSKVNTPIDFSPIKKEFSKKLKEEEENLNKKIEYLEKQLNDEDNKVVPAGLSENDMAMIRDMRKKIHELEKFIGKMFEKINFDELQKKVNDLDTEMQKKASKYEFSELTEKQKGLEESFKDLNIKVDTLQQFTEKLRTEMATVIKKIEFLSGEYAKLAFDRMGKNDNEGKGNVIDMSKFLDINTYNSNKRDINNKFEKVRLGFEDLSREIEEILQKLSHTPSDKDFSQFQAVIKNLLEELKLNCNKKYADKYETAKNIKFLETQIKTISESYRKNDGADNWLLAKKPINGYCASCEAQIRGDLDKRTEYIAWNKYPNREEKSYRLGHGFSRMLQMVNEDIIKSAEKGYSSDEEKKFKKNNDNMTDRNYNVNASVKLPKVRNNRKVLNVNIPTEPNIDNSPYEENDTFDENINNKERPHILKVYRKNKIETPQSATQINNSAVISQTRIQNMEVINGSEKK